MSQWLGKMHKGTKTSFQRQHYSDCLNWSWLSWELTGSLAYIKMLPGLWASRESLVLIGFGDMWLPSALLDYLPSERRGCHVLLMSCLRRLNFADLLNLVWDNQKCLVLKLIAPWKGELRNLLPAFLLKSHCCVVVVPQTHLLIALKLSLKTSEKMCNVDWSSSWVQATEWGQTILGYVGDGGTCQKVGVGGDFLEGVSLVVLGCDLLPVAHHQHLLSSTSSDKPHG